MNNLKIITYYLWIAAIIFLVGYYLYNPEYFTAENISQKIKDFGSYAVAAYLFISVLRGILLIPSTPFVLAGVLLFPGQELLVISISMIGIMLTAAALYYFSDALGYSTILEKKYPKQVGAWKNRLNHPQAILFIIGWAFFPLVPTDLICYVAGIVKMKFHLMAIGIFIGEIILVSIYVYGGSNILALFQI